MGLSFPSRAQKDSAAVEYAIDIVGLEKTFKRRTMQRGGYTTFKSALFNAFRRKKSAPSPVTHAVENLTIRIPKGASVGVIGRNGSGKSTLLKLITGIYKPSRGSVHVRGRTAALIELGAGFHPDFTGRENLYLAGIMLGLKRSELDARFDKIVDFAELRAVIDDPVRTYSSGMFMRLGFSVAVHTDPDVLLIDEVLSVGDAAFVRKCKERVSALRSEGRTLLLVSHDLEAVERWCDEVLWLHQGKVRDRGEPRRVIDHYLEFLEHGEETELLRENLQAQVAEEDATNAAEVVSTGAPNDVQRWGSREIEITSIILRNSHGAECLLFHSDDSMQVELHYKINDRHALKKPVERDVLQDVVFGVSINRNDGLVMHGTNTDIEGVLLPHLSDEGVLSYRIDRIGLLEGSYLLDIAAHRFDGYPFDYRKNAVHFAVRSQGRQVGVTLPPRGWSVNAAASDGSAARAIGAAEHV